MEEYTEDLPWGAHICISMDYGMVSYIDTNLEIRSWPVDKRHRWIPGFLVDNVDPDTIEALKGALRGYFPEAQEMRHWKRGDGFFLCVIRSYI